MKTKLQSTLIALAWLCGLAAPRSHADCLTSPAGLIHWYRGESDGRDSAGTNHGIIESGASAGNAGMVGGAFLLNGAAFGGGVNLGDVPDLDFATNASFSIEAWFKSFGPSGGGNDAQVIVALNNACGNTAQALTLVNSTPAYGVIIFMVRDVNGQVAPLTSSPVSSNQFHHVVGVREVAGAAKTVSLYLDGNLVGSQVDPTTGALALNTADFIGRRNTCGTDNIFNGIIDEVSIYNRALTTAEVAALFNAGSAGKCPSQLLISPATTNAVASSTVTFTASGGTAPYVFTLATNRSGGSITTSGDYTAGPGCGTDTVRVRDALNTSVLAFVNLLDPVGPAITCPSNRIVEATSPSGSVVTFTPTATDNCTTSPTLVSTPPSGSGFPIGTNLVTCRASDAAGNSNSCTFTVTVRDTTPPTITCPANLSVQTTNPAGTTVNFAPSASDVADASPSILCVPASGSTFAPGTTMVTCTTMDDAGNTNACNFTVTVSFIPTAFAVYGRVAASNGVGVAGVNMTLTGGSVNASTSTDGIGVFRFESVGAGTYTLQAARVNHSFAASPLSVTVTSADVRQDFTATRTAIQISGRVTNCVTGESVPNAKLSATGVRKPVLTDAGGYYLFPSVPLRSTINVGASFPSATVTPGTRRLLSATDDRVADFCARLHLEISGSVQDTNGLGIPGATLLLSGSASNSTSTDLGGNYVFRDVPGGNLAVSVTNYNHSFAPANISLAGLLTNGIASFVGTLQSNAPGKIALGKYDDPAGTRIYNTGTGAFVDLTARNKHAILHSWTPDGRRVAFFGAVSVGYGLQFMNPDGSGVLTISNSFDINWPVLSPDGSRFAMSEYNYSYTNGGYFTRLILIDTNGGNYFQLTTNFGLNGISWSPDGRALVFSGRPLLAGAQYALYRINSDGSGLFQLSANGFILPAWSPDGKTIAAQYNNPSNTIGSIYFINPTNGAATLHLTNAYTPCFSPDGSLLAFERRIHTNYSYLVNLIVVPAAGGEERLLAQNSFAYLSSFSWGRHASLPTPMGTKVAVELGNVAMTFSNVISAGNTIIDRQTGVSPRPGYFVMGGIAYEVHSTATFDGPITLCFKVAEVTNQQVFATLRILHAEQNPTNGAVTFVDRTILAPDSPAPDFATKTICARVNSLSPFLIVVAIDPDLPQITGTVVDENGLPLVGAQVTLTGEREATLETDVQGGYLFANLTTNGNYTVSVAKGGYAFDPAAEEITDLGTGADLLFVGAVAPPTPVPALAIASDARFGGLPTLTWPGHPLEFELESTDSLSVTNWLPALESPIPTESGVAVPLAPAGPERYYRLRRP